MVRAAIRDFLPDIIPLDEIPVTDTITYETYDSDSGSIPINTYVLSKGPVTSIRSVEAIVDGAEVELVEGVDYRLDDTDARIEFLQSGTTPDVDSTVTIDYIAQSIIGRFVDTVEAQAESVEEDVETVGEQKYVDRASGNSLDQMGKLFGSIGRRAGRTDEEYRQYLKGLGKAYDSQGTKSSVADVAATVVSNPDNVVTSEAVSFKEYFNENEYSVRFDDFNAHRISQLYEVVDVADPSGVRFVGPIYDTSLDGIDVTEGPSVTESNIDRVTDYDSVENVPSDHIYPIGGSQYLKFVLDIFSEKVESEERKTRTFEWAEQDIESSTQQSGDSWNTFQWEDGSWGADKSADFTITGDDWDFADWNFIPSLGTFTETDELSIGDSTSSVVSTELTEDDLGVTDDAIVRLLVGEEDVRSNDTVIFNVLLSPADTTGVGEVTSVGGGIESSEDTVAENDRLVTTDSTTDSITITTASSLGAGDTTQFDVREVAWGTDWSELYWAGGS